MAPQVMCFPCDSLSHPIEWQFGWRRYEACIWVQLRDKLLKSKVCEQGRIQEFRSGWAPFVFWFQTLNSNNKSYTSWQKLHQSPLYYTVTSNKKYSQTHDKALTSPIQEKKKKSHGPLGSGDHFTWSTRSLRPLTNTKTPHGQHSAVSTSKQAANKINIQQPRQKANNFKLKREWESQTESKGETERERESIPVLIVAGLPPRLWSRREASSSGPGVRRWGSSSGLGVRRETHKPV